MSWYVVNAEDVVGRPTKERPKQRKGKPDTKYGQAAFDTWSGLLSRKGESLQRALGTRVGRILGCGFYGCTVESSPKKVIKLSPLDDWWETDEELKFWTKMKAEQRRPKSPATEGIVKVDHVWVVTDEQTNQMYMVVLRDAVAPFVDMVRDPEHPESSSPKLVPSPTTAEYGVTQISAVLPEYLTQRLKFHGAASDATCDQLDALLDPVLRAKDEYQLGDVHLGNIGWNGGRLVIYDADYRGGDAPKPDKQLRVNRRKRQDPSETGVFRDWDDFLVKKGGNLSRALGVPLKRILGCGALGCVVESSSGKVVKLTEAAAHRALDGSIGDELAFWTKMKAEQRDPDSPASKGVVRVYDVNVIEDRDTGNKYLAVVREAVTPASSYNEHGRFSWTPATNRRVCGNEQCDIVQPWHRWPLAENAFRAVKEYGLDDVHPGNVGWRGDELVVFDAHTDIKYLEPDEMKQMRVNREREVQARRDEYEPTFNEWSRLVALKGDDLQEALGAKVGDIIGCGAFGCVVASDPGKVIKLSSFQAHGGGDEELSFWTHMKSEQKRPNSPASKGVVKIDKVALITDKDTDEDYVAVLRDDVEPLFSHEDQGMSEATRSRLAPHVVKSLEWTNDWSVLPVAAGAAEAVQEYGLTDVHIGNLGWVGDRLVIYDAHSQAEPMYEDLRLRVNDAYSPFREHLQGGLASGMSPEDFDPVQLARGIEVELEHTQDREIATEIAMDHLTEDAEYYERLDRMESGMAPNPDDEELSANPGDIRAGMTAQEAVLRAFQAMRQPFTMAEVERVAEKIERRGDVRNLSGFAYVAVRNYVLSRARAQAAAARHAGRFLERSKAERERERFEASASEELEKIADAILQAGPGPKQTREGLENQINMVLAVYAMGYSSAQTAQLFPGTSKEARYQWKNRGLKLIWPHASAELRRFLHEGGSGHWPTRGEGLVANKIATMYPAVPTSNLKTNARSFYVFEMQGQKPLRQVNGKPLTLTKARQLARIGAQNGKHDRAVTTDPRKDDFEIVERHKAGAR